ncbi:hypothetical protein ABZ926_08485 [Streptomyces litmocidini]|uniref:hypothetical protein n=1 Tax=Streptomyces litmocidini TaxID=67318 RepID=UPI0033D574DF
MLLDATDDVAVTRAALAAHHPPTGRITVHPAPATHHQALAFDILAALGKPPDVPRGRQGQAAWNTATAWIRALPVAQLTILRTHLLNAESLSRLFALPERTGVHLVAVCHTRHPPAAIRTALRHIEHHTISRDDAAAGDLLTPAPQTAPPHREADGRWITVPALAYLAFHQNFPACHCTTPPPATRPYVPDRAYALDQIAHRLATRTASPRLAAALAIAVFTGAPTSQLHTVHYNHFDAAASTLTLHDRYGTRRHGLATNCHTYTVPAWAHPFLRAAAQLHSSPRGDGLLLPHQPRTLPTLTDFAEHCRLRPPQPTPPQHPLTRRTETKTAGSSKTQWYDGYLPPSFEAVSYEQWLRPAG